MNTLRKLSNIVISLGALMYSHSASASCSDAEREFNDTERNATEICTNLIVFGDLGRRDTDWLSFTLEQPSEVTISLDHNRFDDFDWELFAETGPAIAVANTSSIPDTGSQLLEAGQYWLKLTPYAGRGWYDLVVDVSNNVSEPPLSDDDCNVGPRPALPLGLTRFLLGNVNDRCLSLNAGDGAVLLMGGGADVNEAFSNRVVGKVGEGADVVILRTSGSDGYNDYLSQLMNADSVETLVVSSRAVANSSYVDWVVRSAEFVFVAGGDQSDYLNQWEGTLLQAALQSVYDKGGVIGGTSAGMALMASHVYDPDGVAGAVTEEVIRDFCHPTLNFSTSFVNIPPLVNSLTDTHFAERDRMGRALVSLAQFGTSRFSIAADEGTSLFVGNDGVGVVDGSGSIYVLRETAQTSATQLECNRAVVYENVQRIRLQANDSINLSNFSHTGEAISLSLDGNEAVNYYLPSDPYR